MQSAKLSLAKRAANHYDGEDWAGRLLEGFERHPRYGKTEKVRIDIMQRFGYFSTESNGHLSEYPP